jgi:hypothetical protein
MYYKLDGTLILPQEKFPDGIGEEALGHTREVRYTFTVSKQLKQQKKRGDQ